MLTRDDQPVVEGEDHRGGAIAQVELGEDVPDVGLHGALTQDRALGDLTVAESGPDQRQHVPLAWGEQVDLRRRPGARRRAPPRPRTW
jgi:hypothetical protein